MKFRRIVRWTHLLAWLSLLLIPAAGLAETQDALLKKFEAYAAKAMGEWKAPGFAVSIVKGDSVIFAKGYGVRELGQAAPADENTLYAIGSSSKAFTTAAVGMLIDEGKLSWDDPANRYLPKLQLFDPWVTRELRIRDLMAHRIGIDRADALWEGPEFGRDEILRRVRYIEPVTGFRYRFGYNNNMFLAAGQIVASLSGKSWDDFVQERIFQPLGMKRSSTSTLDLKSRENVATPHSYSEGKVNPIPWRNLDNVGPAGSINSSVAEMANWIRFQLGTGVFEGKKLLNPESIKEMHSPQTVIPLEKWVSSMSPVNHQMVPESHFFMYGLGWFMQDYYGRKIIQHGGSIDGMRCLVGMMPEEKLGIVILANINPTSLTEALMFKAFDIFLGTEKRDWSAEMLAGVNALQENYRAARKKIEESRIMGTKPSLPLGSYGGTYVSDAYGEREVKEDNGKLFIRVGINFIPLEHWHFDTFRFLLEPYSREIVLLNFSLNVRGKVEKLKLAGLPEYKKIK